MDFQENQPPAKPQWMGWLPHVLVLVWLVYLGTSIWQHALHSVQPPLYDPLGYMLKAKNFWQAVADARFVNPFNLEPTVRPPGTVLMTYPFGFSPAFKGFYFRSVFLPILSVVASVYIVSGRTHAKESGWWVAGLALLLSSLPMFYYFDWIEEIDGQTRWGLVDNFLAGIAAMAAAATIRSLLSKSLTWLAAGAALASLSLTVKPSGLMVMALVAFLWITMNLVEWKWLSRRSLLNFLSQTYVRFGIIAIIVPYIVVTSISFTSKYLSNNSFEYAKQALVIMREMLQMPFQQMLLLFHQSFGEFLFLWIGMIAFLFLSKSFRNRPNYDSSSIIALGLLAACLVVWGVGAWYWLVVQAGGTQIRYFFPFMLMGIVCIIPAAVHVWSLTNRLLRVLLLTVCLLPALNVGGLLAAGDSPSIFWQKWSGVSVSVGQDREVVEQAYDFLNEVRMTNSNTRVYSFTNGVFPAVFENVGLYEKTVKPELPSFESVLSIDWLRGFAVRVEELLDCDFILVRKYGEQKQHTLLNARKIETYQDETKTFEAWLSSLGENSGVKITSDGQVMRLLRIADRGALASAIEAFVSERDWRPEFIVANKPTFWWNADMVKARSGRPVVEAISFDGIYMLHALAAHRIDRGLKVDLWWEELRHDEANQARRLFIHLLDSAGNIIDNHEVLLYPFKPVFENRRWRHAEVFIRPEFLEKDARSLAFGIFQPPDSFLVADRGKTDWDGRRVLIPIDAESEAIR